MLMIKRLTYVLLAFLVSLPVFAQQQDQGDSLVWLMSAKSAKMVDVEGARYRKVVGPARFLHNGTYLICDTALWNVETKVIDAWGNVSILQDETVLTSDKLTYLVDQDLAQFRGTLVQLTDKDHNTLRTRHLDYNTKDSVAVFMNGGAMRDKDGQIIESRSGSYDSKTKVFDFENDVNMFTDSIFVKTRNLKYESDLNLATFGSGTNAWQDDNMLSSETGWYDRAKELFFFSKDVHVMTPDQEGWCDSLFFHRMTSDVEMLGNAQITDTTRNVFSLAGRIQYQDSLSKVTLTRKPAVITQTEEKDGSVDTVYLGAEKLVYYTVRKCDIDSTVTLEARQRLEALDVDPVGNFRKQAAEEAARAAEEEAMKDPNYRAKKAASQSKTGRRSAAPPVEDSLKVSRDSLVMPPMMPDMSLMEMKDGSGIRDRHEAADTLATADTVEVAPLDTTKIGFLEALHNVRIYKKDMQVVCDSLLYSDLDSLARLFREPLIWQEVRRQYAADSISVVIRNETMDKASLMSNAFIAIQEDSVHFDQIKATEMMAYFDDKGGLKRFDALGGSSALFYIEENDVLATVNKTESKMLSATFKDGEIQRIYYYDSPKNDGYPVVQLTDDEQKLKGFNWQPQKRPADRNAVTPLSLRPSQRDSYTARPRAKFTQTDIYFPGYMNDVYRQIEVRDSLRAVRDRERRIAEAQAAERARLDSLVRADSLALPDSSAFADGLVIADSLKLEVRDSLAFKDSLAVTDSLEKSLKDEPKILTPEELKAAAKAEKERLKAEAKARREEKKKKKQEEREARWSELDRKDAEKALEKENKRLEKERKRKRKALEDQARQAERDAKALEKFRRKYEKQKAREDAKAAVKLVKE
jgi:hypothetical protein